MDAADQSQPQSQRVADASPDARSPVRPRSIALMNQKGGVGKTTTCANVAAALAELGRAVCVIDLDPQAHLTLHLGIDPNELDHSVYDLLTEDGVGVEQVAAGVGDRLTVIPAEVDLAGAEAELVSRPDRQSILARKMQPVLDRFDYVLIDCPPSLGLLTLNALSLAREVIVPMQAHFLALQGLSKLLETVQLVRASVNPHIEVAGVVLCQYEGQTNLAKEVVADLDAFFDSARGQDLPWRGAKVYQPPVRRNVKLAECPSFGQTIFDYEPWCAGGRDYRRLAEAIAAEDGPTPTAGG